MVTLNATDADSGTCSSSSDRVYCAGTEQREKFFNRHLIYAGVYGNVSYLFSKDNTEGEDEFAIDLVTGDITVKNCKLLDSETKTFYSLLVEARDNYRENIISKEQF